MASGWSIQAGDLWREEIEKALTSGRVALLMVRADFLSPDFVTLLMVRADFLSPDFVTCEELPPLFHAAREEGLRILLGAPAPQPLETHPGDRAVSGGGGFGGRGWDQTSADHFQGPAQPERIHTGWVISGWLPWRSRSP